MMPQATREDNAAITDTKAEGASPGSLFSFLIAFSSPQINLKVITSAQKPRGFAGSQLPVSSPSD